MFDPNTIIDPSIEKVTPEMAKAILDRRWLELDSWQGPYDIPELHGQRESWQRFKNDWDLGHAWYMWGKDPVDRLDSQASELAVAESNAGRHGYVTPRLKLDAYGKVDRDSSELGKPTGALSPPPKPSKPGGPNPVVAPPATPSFQTRHPIATAADQIAPSLPGAPKEGDAKGPPDPYLPMKVGGIAAIGLGTIAGAIAAKGDGARVGIAVGGTLIAAFAAWLAFSPDSAADVAAVKKVASEKIASTTAARAKKKTEKKS